MEVGSRAGRCGNLTVVTSACWARSGSTVRSHGVAGTLCDVSRRAPAHRGLLSPTLRLRLMVRKASDQSQLRNVPHDGPLNGQVLKHKESLRGGNSLEAPVELTTQCHRCSGGDPRTGKGHGGTVGKSASSLPCSSFKSTEAAFRCTLSGPGARNPPALLQSRLGPVGTVLDVVVFSALHAGKLGLSRLGRRAPGPQLGTGTGTPALSYARNTSRSQGTLQCIVSHGSPDGLWPPADEETQRVPWVTLGPCGQVGKQLWRRVTCSQFDL